MAGTDTILIDNGDLPSLALLAVQSDPGGIILWHGRTSHPASERRLAVVRDHAATLGPADLIISDLAGPEMSIDTARATSPRAEEALELSVTLFHAAVCAHRLGLRRVLAPTIVGPDHERVGQAIEQANLVMNLIEIGSAPGSIMIDQPLIDLVDLELVELAEDGGAPMDAFWPCETGQREPCETCESCRCWRAAFDELALTWPWQSAKPVVGARC